MKVIVLANYPNKNATNPQRESFDRLRIQRRCPPPCVIAAMTLGAATCFRREPFGVPDDPF
jgi:hypothetical protein